MIRYEMVLGIDLINSLASYDEGLSGTYIEVHSSSPTCQITSYRPEQMLSEG